jgi:hypothetical protein
MSSDESRQPSLTGVAALPHTGRRSSSVLHVCEQSTSRFLRAVLIGSFGQTLPQVHRGSFVFGGCRLYRIGTSAAL